MLICAITANAYSQSQWRQFVGLFLSNFNIAVLFQYWAIMRNHNKRCALKWLHCTAPNERIQIGVDAVVMSDWRIVVSRVAVCILHVGHVCECAMLPRDMTLLFIDVAAPIFYFFIVSVAIVFKRTTKFSRSLIQTLDHRNGLSQMLSNHWIYLSVEYFRHSIYIIHKKKSQRKSRFFIPSLRFAFDFVLTFRHHEEKILFYSTWIQIGIRTRAPNCATTSKNNQICT